MMRRISSMREKPVRHHPRRLADWINPTGAKKVHSLVDKVYRMKNLELAWSFADGGPIIVKPTFASSLTS